MKDNTTARRIQRGELPATTIRELVDAQRQNFAGAGADLDTLRRCLERGDINTALEALTRLEAHVKHANDKATLAFEECAKVVES